MKQNESRQERKKQKNKERKTNEASSGTSKIYYWIIGSLFVILILLVLFIFNRSGNNINLDDSQDQTENIQEEDTNAETPSDDNNVEETGSPAETQESDTEDNDEQDAAEVTEDDEEETDQAEGSEDLSVGESVTVAENLPHNTGYATDYSNGSSDRVEIKERVMEVTGLGNDLIENWVGNDGPGRVVATVSSRDQSEHYEVYLQYGDGSWSVESYQRLSENPF